MARNAAASPASHCSTWSGLDVVGHAVRHAPAHVDQHRLGVRQHVVHVPGHQVQRRQRRLLARRRLVEVQPDRLGATVVVTHAEVRVDLDGQVAEHRQRVAGLGQVDAGRLAERLQVATSRPGRAPRRAGASAA